MKKEKKPKWMSYEEDFKSVCRDYHLEELTKDETLNRMIGICDELQGEICNEADEIKINGLNTVNQILGENIKGDVENVELTKGHWGEIVGLGVRAKTAKTQKLLDKINESIIIKNTVNDLANSVRTKISNGQDADIDIPSDAEFKAAPTESNSDLSDVYKHCVETREHINKVLYKEYYRISKAAQFLFEGELNAEDFKMLVDDIHYANGGYPSASTPPRTWSKINSAYKLIRAMMVAGKDKYIKQYLKDNFGMEVTVRPELERYEWEKKEVNNED